MLDIPCVIFAGGKSSRMGEDKALLPFADTPSLTQFQYNKLSKVFSHVYISCKSKQKFNFDAQFIEDTDSHFSPTAAFVTIFETLDVERFFAISVDTPFLTEDIFTTLYNADATHFDATVAQFHNKLQPLCGIYHRSLYDEFKKMLQNNLHKLTLLLQQSNTNSITFHNEKAFFNLNHPDEYTQALEIVNSSLL